MTQAPHKNPFHAFRLMFLLLMLLLAYQAEAQNNKLYITGKFKIDGGTNNGAKISIEKNGKKISTLDGSSKFEIPLDFNAIYVISFEKEGFVTKKLRFDTNVPEGREQEEFYPFDFTVEIFEQYDDINLVVFNQPVGQISYSDIIDEFDYDTDYTKSIQTQLEQALEEVAEKKEEKLKEEAEKKKEEESINKQIAALTSAASKNMSSGKTDEAIKNLQDALKLKDDPAIAQQLKDAQAKLEGDNLKKEKEQAFNKKFEEAEAALKAGNLEQAQALFEDANGIMGGDPRVTKQLESIKKTIADKKANEQKINQLITDAEAALGSDKPELAKEKASEAAKLGETSKSNQIISAADAAINAKASAQQAEQEKQKAFNNAIAEVEKALKDNNLELASKKLEDAKGIMASDPRISSLQTAIIDKKKELEKLQAERVEKILSMKKMADDALAKNDFSAAKAAVEELKIFGEKDAAADILNRISVAEKVLEEEKSATEATKRKIETLISEADRALKAGDLDLTQSKLDAAKSAGAGAEAQELQSKIDAAKSAAIAQADAEAAKRTAFDSAIAYANAKLSSGQLDEAEKALQKAKDLFVNDQTKALEKSISDAKALVMQQQQAENADKLAQAQLNQLITESKGYLDGGDLKNLKKSIDAIKEKSPGNSALTGLEQGLKELEQKAQLIAQNAENAAAAQKLAEEYKEQVYKADKALAKGELDEAEKAFKAAKSIKADETYPDEQIAAINNLRKSRADEAQKIAAENAAAQLRKDFDALIDAGEKALSANNLNAAVDFANKAAALDVDKVRSEILKNKALAEIEKQNAKKSAAEKEAEINGLLTDANAAFLKGELDEAEGKFDQVLLLEIDNKIAKDGKENIAKKREEIATQKARDAELEAQKVESKFKSLVRQGNTAKTAKRWAEAISKYEEALKLKADVEVEKSLSESKAELEKQKSLEEAKAREAAEVLANNRKREQDQLTKIIEEETSKTNTANAASDEKNDVKPTSQAKAVLEEEARPTSTAGAVFGELKYGEAAKQASPAAKMSAESKYDAQQALIERQQAAAAEEERQRLLKEKYTERKTTETEVVGNSTVTYVYINRGDFVTVYKKVEHSWGGVFYFVDDRSTNQRFWEYSTK